MIFGFVHNREAIVQLAVIGDRQKKEGIRAVVDTGFTGSLTLPLTVIAARFLAESQDEQKWEARFAATTDDQWDQMAAMVRQEIARGETVPLDEGFPARK